jgi:hypothetical protein
MIPLADAALEGIKAHRRIGQEAFRFDAKAEHQTSLDALAGLVALCPFLWKLRPRGAAV